MKKQSLFFTIDFVSNLAQLRNHEKVTYPNPTEKSPSLLVKEKIQDIIITFYTHHMSMFGSQLYRDYVTAATT